ncbi:MAG: sensor histidine kinase [Cyclobacteriaceae bacterium]|jgi:sensor histidine kinase YesM|nr:sensor histidine kinase [Cytophagales bacterium]MCZ8327303.1 sensor histidine kinase [Cyclobacteriaceae bacterium]
MQYSLADFVLSDQLKYRFGRHFLFWFVCWFFFGSLYAANWFIFGAHGTGISYIEALFFLPCHMFLSYSIIYFLFPKYLSTDRYFRLLIGVLIAVLLSVLLSHLITQTLVFSYRKGNDLPLPRSNFFYGLMAGFRGTITVSGFAVAIKLAKIAYLKKEEIEQAAKEKLKAEISFLRGQLQPHFMFNTLNSLYASALKESPRTAQAILRLSDLLRYTITESEQVSTDLTKEINMLHDYCELQRIRFGERIHISWQVHGDAQNKKIAPLLLLPLAENAFKYGTDELLEEGWISFNMEINDGELIFKAINGKTEGRKPSTGIGLQNSRKRLNLLYPNAHELIVHDEPEVFRCILLVQLNKLENTIA